MAIPIASATSSPVVQSSVLAVSTNSREMVKVTFACPSGRNSIRAATPRSFASSSSASSNAAAIICSSGSNFISETSHEIGEGHDYNRPCKQLSHVVNEIHL